MKETILLYNLDSAAIRNKIKFLYIQGGSHIRVNTETLKSPALNHAAIIPPISAKTPATG